MHIRILPLTHHPHRKTYFKMKVDEKINRAK